MLSLLRNQAARCLSSVHDHYACRCLPVPRLSRQPQEREFYLERLLQMSGPGLWVNDVHCCSRGQPEQKVFELCDQKYVSESDGAADLPQPELQAPVARGDEARQKAEVLPPVPQRMSLYSVAAGPLALHVHNSGLCTETQTST